MKRIVLLILMLSTRCVITMERNPQEIRHVTTGMEEGQKQAEFINAIDKGDQKRITELLNAGFDINKPFGLFGYRGHTPLTLALVGQFGFLQHNPAVDRETISRFLLSKGANAAALDEYLLNAVKRGETKEVKKLLVFGAKDSDGAALKYATNEYNELVASKHGSSEIENFKQIIKLLETQKAGPLKLIPKVKPVAQPIAAPAPTKPVEAVTAKQKIILKPTAKPIAKPISANDY